MVLRYYNVQKVLQGAVAKALPRYIHERNLINKGNSEITTLRHIVQVVLIAKLAFSSIPSWLCVIAGMLILIIYRCLGWFWDKNKGYDLEADWSNRRNPFVKHVEKKL